MRYKGKNILVHLEISDTKNKNAINEFKSYLKNRNNKKCVKLNFYKNNG